MSESTEQLKDFAASVVEKAKKSGATAAEAFVRQGFETEVKVRNGEVEQLQQGNPRSIGIRVWVGDRVASTYATDFSDDTISSLLARTIALAGFTDPVPESALPDPTLLARSWTLPAVYDAAFESMTAAEKLELARATEAAAFAADSRVTNSDGASWGDVVMSRALATSDGFCAGYCDGYGGLSAQAIADDADGIKRSGSWSSYSRRRDRIDSPSQVGAIAARRAVDELGSGPIPTAVMPVIFDTTAAGSLVSLLFSVLTGGALERRTSYLLDALGKSVASPIFSLVDDPTEDWGPASRPYDGEGLPARRTEFISNGILQSYAVNSYNARKLGMLPTGHASRPSYGSAGETASNLRVLSGGRTAEDIIAEIPYGFYCRSMMGFGFTPSTGDFSRGASGHLIENGKLTRPVSRVTISGNFREIFADIDAIANDADLRRSIAVPTLRVRKMTLAGQ
jgi:PmbA protein